MNYINRGDISNKLFVHFFHSVAMSLSRTLPLFQTLVILFFPYNNNKALPRFKYCNSRSPLPFPIDLSPITHVKALPD
ncbi:hypothetical protein HanRHA438_Chr01g0036031 [Helianthus annuus]|nr:hypothetical protein HanRHA438_Chr01g0036031 [Helianthus annuus]